MTEKQQQSEFRHELEAHLSSPLPLLMRLRHMVFGSNSPDNYTKFSFFLGLIIWFVFIVWSVLSMVAIRMRDAIFQGKEIDVEQLIENRGLQLGFEPGTFTDRLTNYYTFSVICWILVFIGLVLLWRKHIAFIWFFFGGCGLYLLSMWIMLGFGYYNQDTTFFDKIAFALLIGHTVVYAYFLKREQSGNKIHLFGVDDEE